MNAGLPTRASCGLARLSCTTAPTPQRRGRRRRSLSAGGRGGGAGCTAAAAAVVVTQVDHDVSLKDIAKEAQEEDDDDAPMIVETEAQRTLREREVRVD